jgi:hypothetical protein
MPTVFSHAVVGLPLTPVRTDRCFSRRGVDITQAEILLIWLLGVVAAGLQGRRRGRA